MPLGDPHASKSTFTKLDLSQVDVEELLRTFDVRNLAPEGDGEWRFSCPLPVHQFGDTKPSAYMKQGTTAWNCKSCSATGNAVTFIADVAEVSRTMARRWIVEKWLPQLTGEIENFEFFLRQMLAVDEIEKKLAPVEQILDEVEFFKRSVYWEGVVDARERGEEHPGYYYLLDRGLTYETLDKFQVCWDNTYDRPCLTVRNAVGQIVGFKSRSWLDDDTGPKYLYLGDTERSIAARGAVFGFKPCEGGQHIYGLHHALAQNRTDTCILVEGELNAMKLNQLGYDHAVAPAGSTLTQTQIDLIVNHFNGVMLFIDSDMQDPSKRATARMKLMTMIEQFEPYIAVTVVEDHIGDPMDMPESDVHWLIRQSIDSTTWKLRQQFS